MAVFWGFFEAAWGHVMALFGVPLRFSATFSLRNDAIASRFGSKIGGADMVARMTKAKLARRTTAIEPKASPNDDEQQRDRLAKDLLGPEVRHGELASRLTEAILKGSEHSRRPDFGNFYVELLRATEQAEKGDLSMASRLLVTQAISLDGIFTEMTRRASNNMRDHPQAMEIFMRLALKAQAGSRATLAELAKLHQPREQTVRNVHVNEGGQAVIANQFHHHGGGQENGKNSDQPYEQSPCGPALLGHDPLGNGVPITGVEGQAALSPSRRAFTGGT